MMVPHHFQHNAIRHARLPQRSLPDERVSAYCLVLFFRKSPGLVQNFLGDIRLAKVVQQSARGDGNSRHLPVGEHPVRQKRREQPHVDRVREQQIVLPEHESQVQRNIGIGGDGFGKHSPRTKQREALQRARSAGEHLFAKGGQIVHRILVQIAKALLRGAFPARHNLQNFVQRELRPFAYRDRINPGVQEGKSESSPLGRRKRREVGVP